MEILIKILIIVLGIGIFGMMICISYALFFASIRQIFSGIRGSEKIVNIGEESNLNNSKAKFWSEKDLKNKKGESILKYIDPKMEKIKYLKFYPTPIKFECGKDTLEMFNLARVEKKESKYSRAYEIYKNILDKDGPSGTLYIDWAKVLMCKEHWPEGLYLFKLANEIYYREYNTHNNECLCHINMIEKLYEKDFYEVYNYMKVISGNDEYRFPQDGDIAKKLKLLVKLKVV